MENIDLIKKVDLTYPDLKDTDIIETFAVGKQINGELGFEIKDYNLTEEQKSLFQKTANIYSKFTKINDLYMIYLSDFANFNKNFQDVEKGNLKLDFENSGKDFNRFFIHILSSARLFTTYIENDLKKEFGKHSPQFEKWKKITAKVYDNVFAYRFSYHLRNYTQHQGLPIATITTTVLDDHPNKVCKCKMKLSTKYLIDSGYSWNKKIKSDLIAINGDIDIYDVLNGLMTSMTLIYGEANEIFLMSNHHELMNLEKKLKKIYSNSELPFLAKITKYDLKYNRSYNLTPLIGLRKIHKIYYELSKLGIVELNIIE